MPNSFLSKETPIGFTFEIDCNLDSGIILNMTNEDKFKAIAERAKITDKEIDGNYLSTMVIIGYLNDMADLKLIQTAFTMTSTGRNLRSICEEFEWKPSDKDIAAFVVGMVEEEDREAFAVLLTKYRDDREKFLEDYITVRKMNGG
jgi:hypothetical protein